MKKFTVLLTALFLAAAPYTLANEPEPHFFRVEMQTAQPGEEPTEVSLNLPLSTIRAMGPQIQQTIDEGLNEIEVEGETLNLREIWAEIQAVGPHEYARINGPDADVVVSTTDSHLVIEVADEDQELTARIPLSVGDILLGSEEVDFEAIVDQLVELEEEYLIEVTGTVLNMRAWVQ